VNRSAATIPAIQKLSTGKVLFPKDGRAGGTWIAIHNNGNAMVLLNGASERHIPNPPYKKSRGLIFLDIFDASFPSKKFAEADLRNIEPFTLILWENKRLFNARWDGSNAVIEEVCPETAHIWSSVTLYSKEVIAKREQWFRTWRAANSVISGSSVLAFHQFGGEGDEEIDLKMNRNDILRTVSITGIELSEQKSVMYYKDIQTGTESVNEWLFAHNWPI